MYKKQTQDFFSVTSDDDEGRFLRQTKVGRLSAIDAVGSLQGVQTQYAQKTTC